MPKTLTAVNMSDSREVTYSFPTDSLTPYQDIAIRAHAQSIGDYSLGVENSGRYAAKMGHHFTFCGDWAVRLPR